MADGVLTNRDASLRMRQVLKGPRSAKDNTAIKLEFPSDEDLPQLDAKDALPDLSFIKEGETSKGTTGKNESNQGQKRVLRTQGTLEGSRHRHRLPCEIFRLGLGVKSEKANDVVERRWRPSRSHQHYLAVAASCKQSIVRT